MQRGAIAPLTFATSRRAARRDAAAVIPGRLAGCNSPPLRPTAKRAGQWVAPQGERTPTYSACTVCSPTRAAILTGKYPARLHITDWIPGLPPSNPKLLVPDWTKHLPTEETTFARVLKEAGYATASVGKWHLGGEPYYPEKHGFARNVAGTAAPAPQSYFAPWQIPILTREGRDGEYLTDRLGQEAVKFIEQHRDRPFFLYLAHFGVHTPIQGKADLVKKHQARLKPELRHGNAAYVAMLESVDDTVGLIRAKLAELRLAERTVIVFTSDNGGRVPTTSNHPLRVGKGSCYEGGVRVPLIIHWPGVTEPGSVRDVPAMSIDFSTPPCWRSPACGTWRGTARTARAWRRCYARPAG